MTSLISHFDTEFSILSVSPDDYRLIQVFCHECSFVFFNIIVIRLEAWLIDKL